MTQTEIEAALIHTYLTARGYTVSLAHVDATGIRLAAYRAPLDEPSSATPLSQLHHTAKGTT